MLVALEFRSKSQTGWKVDISLRTQENKSITINYDKKFLKKYENKNNLIKKHQT